MPLAPAPFIWLDRLTTLIFSLTLCFAFCGMFLLPEGKTILSNLLAASIVFGLLNVVVGGQRDVGLLDRRILWVFLGYALFILCNRLVHGDQYGVMRSLGYVALFGLLIPRKAVLLTVSRYAIIAGGLGLGALSLWQVHGGITRVEGFTNAILFSIAALMLVLLCWYLCHEQQGAKWEKVLAGAALTMSLYGLYASQSRGVWLALIAVIVVRFIVRARIKPLKYMGLFVVLVVSLFLLYQQSSVIKTRINLGVSDLQKAEKGVYGTSWGLRLVAWQGAWQGFLTSPVLGVGTEGFDSTKQQLVASGKSSNLLLDPALAHSHSQFMQNLFIRGAIGFVALCLFLGLPLWWGIKFGGMSSMLTLYPLAFTVSGLTDVPLEHQNVIYLYALGLLFLWVNVREQEKCRAIP